ncbi:MAG: hypothetical protein FJ263_10985 [Planctomycetes bacterium]|nr:hypothetical protein [Planctomycetota bacterium]
MIAVKMCRCTLPFELIDWRRFGCVVKISGNKIGFALHFGMDFPIHQLRFQDGWQRDAASQVLINKKAEFFVIGNILTIE